MKKTRIFSLLNLISVIYLLLLSFCFCACPKDPKEKDPYEVPAEAKSLKILQIGASTDGNISHSFIELYNFGDTEISLTGFSLQYASGFSTNEGNGAIDGSSTKDGTWHKINFTGSIKSGHSFLILGKKGQWPTSETDPPALAIADNSGDMNVPSMVLNNRSCKVVIIKSTALLSVQNPFNIDGAGKKASGYIDMLGAINSEGTDYIQGYEGLPFIGLSKQVGLRRTSTNDTDNNKADFERIAYANESGNAIEYYRPKNSAYGIWDPFESLKIKGLMIFQVFGSGPVENDSAPTHNFIELYNNSNEPIDLNGFSVHYASGASSGQPLVSPWTKIDLAGTIPAKSSYLILGKQMVTFGQSQTSPNNGRLDFTGTFIPGTLTVPDLTDSSFVMSNRSYKVALMSNQISLPAVNPWRNSACIDLVSAINTSGADSIDAAKGQQDLNAVNSSSGGSRTISKQKSFRRTSLNNTGVTLTDFASKQYSTLSTDDIIKFRPRTTADAPYTPEF